MRRNIKIDRFWDLFITPDDGTTDLGNVFKGSLTYRKELQRIVSIAPFIKLEKGNQFVLVDDQKVQRFLERLDANVTYTASIVTIGALRQANPPSDRVTQALVTWINDPKAAGKLRVTAHGGGGSSVTAMDSQGKGHDVDAGAIIAWLISNGLVANKQPEPKGLVRITMRTCFAARSGETVGSSEGVHPGSVLGEMKAKLDAEEIHGIELVGLNEIAAGDGRHLWRIIGMPSGYGWGKIRRTGEKGGRLRSYEVSVPSSNSSFTFFPDHFVLNDHVFEKNQAKETLEFRPRNKPDKTPALTLSMDAGWVFVADDSQGRFLFYYPTNWQYDDGRKVLKTSDTTRLDRHADKSGDLFVQKAAKSGAKVVVIS